MRSKLMAVATMVGLMAGSQAAYADFIFAGSGQSGSLASASEIWEVNSAAPDGDFGWGSPGVNQGSTTYGQSVPATNFEITFFGDVLDEAQIAIGNALGCSGTSVGGTTFCGDSTPWTAVLVSPSSIAFFAPPGESLSQGESYFVNIFLVGTVHDVNFEGFWSTAAVPEPASLVLLSAGLAGLGLMRRRRSLEPIKACSL